MDKHTAYFNIQHALPQSGCVFCRLGHDVEISYIRDVLYSKTTSIKTRAELRQARGFCLAHAKQLDEIGHALDLSIIYQDILITLKQMLEKPSPQRAASKRGKKQLAGVLDAEAECPACTYRAQLEEIYVETFLDHLMDPEFVGQVRVADPLCLPHFLAAIRELTCEDQFKALRDSQLDHWDQLIVELGEFVRKNDHRFQQESVGQEGTAWIRAIDAITGTRKF